MKQAGEEGDAGTLTGFPAHLDSAATVLLAWRSLAAPHCNCRNLS